MVFRQAPCVPIGRDHQDLTASGVQTGIMCVNWQSLTGPKRLWCSDRHYMCELAEPNRTLEAMVFIQASPMSIPRLYQDLRGNGVQTGIMCTHWQSPSPPKREWCSDRHHGCEYWQSLS